MPERFGVVRNESTQSCPSNPIYEARKEVGVIGRPEVREEACIRERLALIEKTLMCCLGISEDLARRIGTGVACEDNERRVACMTVSGYLNSIEQIACSIRIQLDQIRLGL